MSDGNRQRPSIDLDDLERQLRAVAQPKAAQRSQPQPQASEPAPLPFAVKPVFSAQLPENESFAEPEQESLAPPPAPTPAPLPSFLTAAAPKAAPRVADYDPLAELARIAQSGNDWSVPKKGEAGTSSSPSGSSSAVDALEALLRMDPPVKAPPPSLPPLPLRRSEPQPASIVDDQPALDFTIAAPAEPAPLAGVYAEAEPIYAPEGQLPPHDQGFVDEEPQPRPRSGMKLAAALVSVAAIGVGAVFFWRGGDGASVSGGPRTPPVIKASNEPTKVAPANPGGMEVANSNQEIFAGSKGNAPAPAPGKVVTTEEQPVDVNAVAKPRVILPNGGSAATVPPAPPPPISTLPRDAKAPPTAPAPSVQTGSAPQAQAGVAALGEPKKVRTVLVRPDGTVLDGTEPVKPPSMAAVPSVVPSSPVPTQTLPAAAASPPPTGAPPPAIVPASPAPAAPEPAAQPAPGTPLPPRRPAVAAATPMPEPAPAAQKPAPAPQPAAPQAVAAAASGGAGDFAVQLAAPPTEAEARSLASRLTQRYGDALAGQEPEIIRADVNGKTLYRVRVTGLDRESANTMCNRIKSAQGSCFVAKN